MKLRYIEHHVLQGVGTGQPHVTFAGVWVHGPDFTKDLDYRYMPGFGDQEDWANDIINDIVDRGDPIPDDILENIANSGYLNAFGQVEETDKYDSIPALEDSVFQKREGRKTA